MKRLNYNQKRYFEKIWYVLPNISNSLSVYIDIMRNGKVVSSYDLGSTRYFVDEIPSTSYDDIILHYNGDSYPFGSMVTLYNALIKLH